MREVELKAVVDDWDGRQERLVSAGARLAFAGRLRDRRYDTPSRDIASRDEVLRLRVYESGNGARAELGWKGPTDYSTGYKVREEIQSSAASDGRDLAIILERLGYIVTRAIDRDIAQYEIEGTVIRFERYPRMDDLVEVEGDPDAIERAIALLGLPRSAFTSDRLRDFAERYARRTGSPAALCDGELRGDVSYGLDDA